MLDLKRLVLDHVRSFNEELPEARRRIAESPEAVVIGPGTSFDSLDAVEFLMGLEDKVAARLGRRIDICHPVEGMEQETVTVADVTACVERLVAETLPAGA